MCVLEEHLPLVAGHTVVQYCSSILVFSCFANCRCAYKAQICGVLFELLSGWTSEKGVFSIFVPSIRGSSWGDILVRPIKLIFGE